MCLHELTKTDKTITNGYKIFFQHKETNELYQTVFDIRDFKSDPITGKIRLISRDRETVPEDTWLKATKTKITYAYFSEDNFFEHGGYWSGFHFFREYQAAEAFIKEVKDPLEFLCGEEREIVIKPIEVKEIVASGRQHKVECHVARYMNVLSVNNGK